eukprot:gene35044-43211_t
MRNGYGPSIPLIAELCRDGTLWGVKHAVLPDVFMSQAKQLLELEPSLRLYTGSDKLSAQVLDFSDETSIGLKYAMRARGLSAGVTRQPVGYLPEEKKREIDE